MWSRLAAVQSAKQGDEVGVQGDVAVVAQLADGDPQPVAVTDEHDGVSVEVAQLSGTHSGAGEDLDDEAVAGVGGGAGGGHQPGGVTVVEELGQRLAARWDVATDDRVAGGGVGPVPLDDSFEEHAQHVQPLTLRGRRQTVAADAGLVGEPHLVVLDVTTTDVGDGPHVGVLEQPAGELPQRQIGGHDAVGGEHRGDLGEVSGQRVGHLRGPGGDPGPLAGGLPAGGLRSGQGAHAPAASSWTASISATAAWLASISAAAR